MMSQSKNSRLVVAGAMAIALATSSVSFGASSSWKSTSTTAWGTGGNWTAGAPGNTTAGVTPSADYATFPEVISGQKSVVWDAGRTLTGITFTNQTGSYNI